MSYSCPGLEAKFKHGGNIIFLGIELLIPKGTDIVEWNGQKMTMEAFIRLDLKQQIVVTKEKNGELWAREKEVFARASCEAYITLMDSYGVPHNGRNGCPPFAGIPGGRERYDAISDEERAKKVWEILINQREEAAKANAASSSN